MTILITACARDARPIDQRCETAIQNPGADTSSSVPGLYDSEFRLVLWLLREEIVGAAAAFLTVAKHAFCYQVVDVAECSVL